MKWSKRSLIFVHFEQEKKYTLLLLLLEQLPKCPGTFFLIILWDNEVVLCCLSCVVCVVCLKNRKKEEKSVGETEETEGDDNVVE